ncbi:hypothetical protein OfM1_04790 [Lactovum odontotermitis]
MNLKITTTILGRKAKLSSAILLSSGSMIFTVRGAADIDTFSDTVKINTADKPFSGEIEPQLEREVPSAAVSAPSAANAAAKTAAKTLNQALTWAKNQRGLSLDVDGTYGAQCADLTMAYSEYLFGNRTYGDAADYSRNNYNGFTRLSKAQTKPQPGDVAVWTGGFEGRGHVGLVIASSGDNFTTLEQNVNGDSFVRQYSRNTEKVTDIRFWGVQRPNLVADSPVPTVTNAVYRLYNSQNGDHIYTVSHYEAESLRTAGLHYDGIYFYAASNGTKIYRNYNPNSGEHFYTANKAEYDNLVRVGWKGEGISWTAPNDGTNVYRVYNPNGFHIWTTSPFEVNNQVAAGWRNEGVVFKG